VGQFGDKFRKAREKKGMSLDDVSNVTKIGSRMLQAIEEEHFEQLPGGVFNKGFIRAYAKQVGLNDEDAVNEYLACLRQAQIDAQAIWEPHSRESAGKPPHVAPQVAVNKVVADRSPSRSIAQAVLSEHNAAGPGELPELQLPRIEDVRRPRRDFAQKREREIPWRPAAIAVLLLIAAGVVWQHHVRHAHAESAIAPAPPVASPPPEIAQAPAPQSAVSDLSSTSKPAPAKAQPARPSSLAAPSSTSPATKPARAAANDGDDDVTPPPAPAKTAPVDETPAPLMLIIRANENSWISVTADGQPASQETLIAPANTSIRAKNQIVAKVGNAAGVSFLWNGQEIQPEGGESEVKTFVFDSAGMHEVGSSPAGQSRP
jgi:cytoskeleton protein RodZ